MRWRAGWRAISSAAVDPVNAPGDVVNLGLGARVGRCMVTLSGGAVSLL